MCGELTFNRINSIASYKSYKMGKRVKLLLKKKKLSEIDKNTSHEDFQLQVAAPMITHKHHQTTKGVMSKQG